VSDAGVSPTLLDGVLSGADYAELQELWVPTPPGKAFRALSEVTPSDTPEILQLAERGGAWLAHFGLARSPVLSPDRPMYAQLLEAGFVVLTADPLTEVVVGRVARPWRLADGGHPSIRGRHDFVHFGSSGFLKAAVSLRLAPEGDGTLVTLELRLRATDLGLRRLCKILARLAGPTAKRAMRRWLQAVERRAAQL
jgi:hypothetical protein